MNESIKISVIGLGYVGLPVAIEFAKKYKTIGFDIDSKRISELKNNYDMTLEVTEDELKNTEAIFTDNDKDLAQANFHIIAVPTPINKAQQPDLSIVYAASKSVGKTLKKGDIVVYESTVYPGATEEDCAPILEAESGLKCGVDFTLGYSPERINPGDKEHSFSSILKVVSGQDKKTLDIVADVYASVVKAGVHKAESIKVAEAAKVIENSQRDLNIAFMNELSLIFDRMGIDTNEVLRAAGTKWNFLKFSPGLVGGHCIGVDPYYLTYKAQSLGYKPEVILAGRKINDNMGNHVAQQVVNHMTRSNISVCNSTVTVLGLTFKEDCPDLRNTRVTEIIKYLKDLNINIQISDPMAEHGIIEKEFGMSPTPMDELKPSDAIILAVPHKQIVAKGPQFIKNLLKNPAVVADIKGAFEASDFTEDSTAYWRL